MQNDPSCVWQYRQDVWKIYITRRRLCLGRKNDFHYFCDFGYFLAPRVFRSVRCFITVAQDKPFVVSKAESIYKKYLQRYPTQKDLSNVILEYLQNPRRGFGNFDFRFSIPELLYRGVPVPLYRNDFPNKTAILMILEAKANHLIRNARTHWEKARADGVIHFLKLFKNAVGECRREDT